MYVSSSSSVIEIKEELLIREFVYILIREYVYILIREYVYILIREFVYVLIKRVCVHIN